MHRRAHVVTEAVEGQGLGPGPAPDRRRPLEHLHPEAGPGQRQRGGQAVGPRADHDGVRTLHEATLPSAAGPRISGRTRRLATRPPRRPRPTREGGPHGRGARNLRAALRAGARHARRPARDGRRPRRLRRRLPARGAGRRHLGRLGRRGEDPALGARHHHQRLVHHEDDDLPRRADAARPRRARLPRARRHLLARVRRQRQGADRGAPRHGTHRRPERLGGAAGRRGPGQLGAVHVPAGRPGAVVGARQRLGLPRA